MKVSFIICYSSTKAMTIFDNKSWPIQDTYHDESILAILNFYWNKLVVFQ